MTYLLESCVLCGRAWHGGRHTVVIVDAAALKVDADDYPVLVPEIHRHHQLFEFRREEIDGLL